MALSSWVAERSEAPWELQAIRPSRSLPRMAEPTARTKQIELRDAQLREEHGLDLTLDQQLLLLEHRISTLYSAKED